MIIIFWLKLLHIRKNPLSLRDRHQSAYTQPFNVTYKHLNITRLKARIPAYSSWSNGSYYWLIWRGQPHTGAASDRKLNSISGEKDGGRYDVMTSSFHLHFHHILCSARPTKPLQVVKPRYLDTRLVSITIRKVRYTRCTKSNTLKNKL